MLTMENLGQQPRTLETLNVLLKDLMETELRYMECVNQIFHRGVRVFFVTQTQTKNKFVHQLALEIQKMGGEISTIDVTQVGHFKFYNQLRSVSYDAILDACIAIEQKLIAYYENLLKDETLNYSETTAYLLLRQKTELEQLLSKENVQIYRTHEKLVS